MTNSVLYDASNHDIHSVSVFQANCAEINRRVEVELKEGQNEVEIANLPTCLEQDSVRVDGVGQATIFDVVYSPPPPIDLESRKSTLSVLNIRKSALEAEWNILYHQGRVLVDYSVTLKGSDTSTDQLMTFLNVYQEKQRSLNEGMAILQEKIRQVEDEISGARCTLSTDEESLKRAVKITVIVLADQDGPAKLSLTYVVPNSWWTPIYDLRVALAHNTDTSNTVRLHYRASVAQSTGEDWVGVALTLSTASPLQGTVIPTLHPERVTAKYKPTSFRSTQGIVPLWTHSRSWSPIEASTAHVRHSRSRSPTSPAVHQPRIRMARSETANAYGHTLAPPPGFFTMSDSVAAEGAGSVTFTVAGLSSIPSNTSKSSQAHKVSVAEIEVTAFEFEWTTIPKVAPCVFLECKVQNTSEYVLLPGQISIFMNNNFVSKSKTIPHVSPNESFSCSLGVDPDVRVTYHPQIKKVRSIGILSSKTTGTTFRQSTTIKNTRTTALRRLILKDQVPVSDIAKIKVNVLEPKDLQTGSNSAKETVVKEGVKARWAQKNADAPTIEEGDGDTKLGFIEWICQIGPGASVDVDLAWEVIGVPWTRC